MACPARRPRSPTGSPLFSINLNPNAEWPSSITFQTATKKKWGAHIRRSRQNAATVSPLPSCSAIRSRHFCRTASPRNLAIHQLWPQPGRCSRCVRPTAHRPTAHSIPGWCVLLLPMRSMAAFPDFQTQQGRLRRDGPLALNDCDSVRVADVHQHACPYEHKAEHV